ncbi:MAG: hypothetical protein ACK40G_12920 [Cytophagaceae bacterium]
MRKGTLIFYSLFLISLFSCKRDNVNSVGAGYISPEASMYIKDRKMEDFSTSRSNSHGSVGPGTGSSYSSGSYRQSAIEQTNDYGEDSISSTITNPQRGDLAADTVDTGKSW